MPQVCMACGVTVGEPGAICRFGPKACMMVWREPPKSLADWNEYTKMRVESFKENWLKEWLMKNRDPLLEERQKTHGSFEVHATTTWAFKDILEAMPNWENLSARHKEALHMIVHKIGRIASGNPNFKDHWDDIAGYAKLGSEACEDQP